MTNKTKELSFLFHLVLINLDLNENNRMWLVATMLESTDLGSLKDLVSKSELLCLEASRYNAHTLAGKPYLPLLGVHYQGHETINARL